MKWWGEEVPGEKTPLESGDCEMPAHPTRFHGFLSRVSGQEFSPILSKCFPHFPMNPEKGWSGNRENLFFEPRWLVVSAVTVETNHRGEQKSLYLWIGEQESEKNF